MKSALLKDIFREIKGSKSRFFSIFAIIALGAGFFAGLKATYPDMIHTQEQYFEEQNLMDIRLVSTYGFDEKDIAAISEVEGIKDLYPAYSKDVFIEETDGSGIIAKLMAYPDSGVNTPVLLEGRLPENPGECLAEKHSQMAVSHDIGDIISVYTTDPDDPIEDSLVNTTWEVVGLVMTPQYISYSRGTASIGDGSADTFIMVPEENFCLEVYTEVYVTLDSAKDLSAFSEEYSAAVEKASDDFEKVAEEREKLRFDEIKNEAYDEINEAKEEIAEAEKELSDAEEELLEAKAELEEGEKELEDGRKEYFDGLKEYNEGLAEYEKEISDAEEQLSDAEKQIDDGWSEYSYGLHQYEEGMRQFEEGLEAQGMTVESLYATRILLEPIVNLLESLPGMEEQAAQLTAQLAEIETAIAGYEELLAAEEQLEDARRELYAAEEELEDGREELEEKKAEAEAEFLKAEKELEDGRKELADGEREFAEGLEEYNDGLKEFEEAKAEAEAEIADAKAEIADAEAEIEKLREPVWYIFTREDNPNFTSFETSAYIVEKVGKVFPVFFFIVAMLVCLTTMTRMVEEKRTETGTLKALGYKNGAALAKYLVYAALASISGAVFGIGVCVFVFPFIIHTAYGIMFILPKLRYVAMPGTWILAVVICILCTTLAVLIAGYSELREKPAELMRPKAPKAGKRVLLERIPAIWKRLSFNRKVTVRNLFRYKKRISMTILGIAGCAALTIAGFGIYASLSSIIDKQYGDIFNYDLLVSLDTDSGEEEIAKAIKKTAESEYTEKSLPIHIMSVNYEGLGNINLMTVSDTEVFEDFIVLRELDSRDKIELDSSGVVITERFAEIFGFSSGDEITFYSDEEEFTAKIIGVTEHYAMHFIYMTDEFYEKNCKSAPEINAVLTTMTDPSEKNREIFGHELMEQEGIIALSFSETEMKNFHKTIENLNYVVILIIVCAAALAFIVLYNLTNINITERIREIATIKVLGFLNIEVDAYVFRENMILSIIGALAGLLLGKGLFGFILSAIKSDEVLFVEYLPWWCYLCAFGMTILFSAIVNGIMHFRLKKISMVESLKSIE